MNRALSGRRLSLPTLLVALVAAFAMAAAPATAAPTANAANKKLTKQVKKLNKQVKKATKQAKKANRAAKQASNQAANALQLAQQAIEQGGKQGPAGPAGPEGPQGPPGEDGQDGAPGADGENGQDGAPGPEGPAGDPWTAGGTLPESETLRGAWSFGQSNTGTTSRVPVSFPVWLSEALPGENVHVINDAGNEVASPDTDGDGTAGDNNGNPQPACTGSAAAPTAAAGHLCVYIASLFNASFPAGSGFSVQPVMPADAGIAVFRGAARSGAILNIEATSTAASGWGAFAVTNPVDEE